jgi:hypothetical protein
MKLFYLYLINILFNNNNNNNKKGCYNNISILFQVFIYLIIIPDNKIKIDFLIIA